LSGYRLTPRALKDLDQIADYTLAQWGEHQMEKYLSNLATRFQWLSQNPGVGRLRDEVGQGYRSYRQGSHLIFYIVENDVVAIIGVTWFHGYRRLFPIDRLNLADMPMTGAGKFGANVSDWTKPRKALSPPLAATRSAAAALGPVIVRPSRGEAPLSLPSAVG
jgi:toxin ParE1/3/4